MGSLMNQEKNNSQDEFHQQKTLAKPLDLLRKGNFAKAHELFDELLDIDYSNKTAETGMKCCKYWINRIQKIQKIREDYKRGTEYFEQWEQFVVFTETTMSDPEKNVISNIMFYIFNQLVIALENEIKKNKIVDLHILFLTGYGYKKIGNFEKAEYYFSQILQNDYYNANAMVQLADCYALIDQDKKSKILFKEAFFISPGSININLLDSNMIQRLILKIIEKGIEHEYLKLWIPVYGRIYSFFNYTRELLPIEQGKIQKEIFQLEGKFNNNSFIDRNDIEFCKTRLLNNYFWLYDNYNIKKKKDEERNKLYEKIKFISIDIYEEFKKTIQQEIK